MIEVIDKIVTNKIRSLKKRRRKAKKKVSDNFKKQKSIIFRIFL